LVGYISTNKFEFKTSRHIKKMSEKKKKIKIRNKAVLSKMDQLLLKATKEYYDTVELPEDQKRELQKYLSNLNVDFCKNMKSNVELMSSAEITLSAPTEQMEPDNEEISKRVNVLTQQVNAVAKRISLFRELYTKEVEKRQHEDYFKEIENLKQKMEKKEGEEETFEPSDLSDNFDTFSRALKDAQELVAEIPPLNEKLKSLQEAHNINEKYLTESTSNISTSVEETSLETPKKKRGRKQGWKKEDSKKTKLSMSETEVKTPTSSQRKRGRKPKEQEE
jgi:hypothetical protein